MGQNNVHISNWNGMTALEVNHEVSGAVETLANLIEDAGSGGGHTSLPGMPGDYQEFEYNIFNSATYQSSMTGDTNWSSEYPASEPAEGFYIWERFRNVMWRLNADETDYVKDTKEWRYLRLTPITNRTGDVIYTSTTAYYKRSNSATNPPAYSQASDIAKWSTSFTAQAPTENENYCWCANVVSIEGDVVTTAGEPYVCSFYGSPGGQGGQGYVYRYRGEWESGTTYYNGEDTSMPETAEVRRFVDYVSYGRVTFDDANKAPMVQMWAYVGTNENSMTAEPGSENQGDWDKFTTSRYIATDLIISNQMTTNIFSAISGSVKSLYTEEIHSYTTSGDVVSIFNQSITGLTSRVQSLETSGSTMKEQYSELRNSITGFSSTVGRIEDTLSGHTEQISTLQNSYTGLTSRVQSLETSDKTLNKQFSELKNTATGLSATVSAITEDLNGINSSITQLKTTAKGITGDVSTLRSDINSVSGDVSTLKVSAGNFNSTIKTLSGNVKSLSGNVDSLSGTVSTYDGRINGLQSQIDQTANRISMSVSEIGYLNMVEGTALRDFESDKWTLIGDASVSDNQANIIFDHNSTKTKIYTSSGIKFTKCHIESGNTYTLACAIKPAFVIKGVIDMATVSTLPKANVGDAFYFYTSTGMLLHVTGYGGNIARRFGIVTSVDDNSIPTAFEIKEYYNKSNCIGTIPSSTFTGSSGDSASLKAAFTSMADGKILTVDKTFKFTRADGGIQTVYPGDLLVGLSNGNIQPVVFTNSGGYNGVMRFQLHNNTSGQNQYVTIDMRKDANGDEVKAGEWALIKKTFTASFDVDNILAYGYMSGENTVMSHLMVSEGDKYYGWSYSPYDTDEEGVTLEQLKATGIDIEQQRITAYGDNFVVASDAERSDIFMQVTSSGLSTKNISIEGDSFVDKSLAIGVRYIYQEIGGNPPAEYLNNGNPIERCKYSVLKANYGEYYNIGNTGNPEYPTAMDQTGFYVGSNFNVYPEYIYDDVMEDKWYRKIKPSQSSNSDMQTNLGDSGVEIGFVDNYASPEIRVLPNSGVKARVSKTGLRLLDYGDAIDTTEAYYKKPYIIATNSDIRIGLSWLGTYPDERFRIFAGNDGNKLFIGYSPSEALAHLTDPTNEYVFDLGSILDTLAGMSGVNYTRNSNSENSNGINL